MAKDIDPEWFEEGDTIRVADEFVVDVMFNACGEIYESLRPYARTVTFDDGTEMKTLDLDCGRSRPFGAKMRLTGYSS